MSVVISPDTVITIDDLLLIGGTESVSAGLAAGAFTQTFLMGGLTIPPNSPTGNMYLGVLIDPAAAVNEYNETDNAFFAPVDRDRCSSNGQEHRHRGGGSIRPTIDPYDSRLRDHRRPCGVVDTCHRLGPWRLRGVHLSRAHDRCSLDAIEWYRSGNLTSAHLYRAASVHEIDLSNPLVSLGNVSENLDVWETRPLANPLGGGMPIYLVFRMSAAQGAGLAYVDEPNGLPIYASAGDGDWYRVASSLSPAVRPHLSSTIFGGGSSGTMNRSVAEPPAQADRVATALLDPTPNPSNPSTPRLRNTPLGHTQLSGGG